MEATLLAGSLAAVFAFVAASIAVDRVLAGIRRRQSLDANQGQGSSDGWFAWRLRNGFPFLMPLVSKLFAFGRIRDFFTEAQIALQERGFIGSPQALCSVILVMALAVGALLGIIVKSWLCVVAGAGSLLIVFVMIAGNARDRRREAVSESVPAVLESLAACFSSGFSLMQTFEQVASEVGGPLSKSFSRAAHVLQTGGSVESALSGLRSDASSSELAFVTVALDVQHQSGGAMRQVLDAAAETVKGQLALKRSLRVQTAQARLSARVVSVMPFLLVAAFSIASPDFLAPFFESPFGYALLTLAIGMQVTGVVLVRRVLATGEAL